MRVDLKARPHKVSKHKVSKHNNNWSQIVIFSYPLAFGRPVRGVPVGILPSRTVWCGKTRMVGLPDGGKTLRICIVVYTQHRRVTNGQTDGQTSCHGIVRVMHTRRAVK